MGVFPSQHSPRGPWNSQATLPRQGYNHKVDIYNINNIYIIYRYTVARCRIKKEQNNLQYLQYSLILHVYRYALPGLN